jgi:hypothetical protein
MSCSGDSSSSSCRLIQVRKAAAVKVKAAIATATNSRTIQTLAPDNACTDTSNLIRDHSVAKKYFSYERRGAQHEGVEVTLQRAQTAVNENRHHQAKFPPYGKPSWCYKKSRNSRWVAYLVIAFSLHLQLSSLISDDYVNTLHITCTAHREVP